MVDFGGFLEIPIGLGSSCNKEDWIDDDDDADRFLQGFNVALKLSSNDMERIKVGNSSCY